MPHISRWLCLWTFLVLHLPLFSQTPHKDVLAVGTVWKGDRKSETQTDRQGWKLSITNRTGDTFKGILDLGVNEPSPFEVAVTGSGPAAGSGPIHFETDKKGKLKQRCSGQINNGTMSLNFDGTSRNGYKTSGKGWLQLSSPR